MGYRTNSSSLQCQYLKKFLHIRTRHRIFPSINQHENIIHSSIINASLATNFTNYSNEAGFLTIENGYLDTGQNVTNSSQDNTDIEGSISFESAKWYMLAVVQPTLCCFGIIGNLLSIVVLSRKKFKCSLDSGMEIAAVCGLISLALSDMFYCLSVLPEAFLSKFVTVFGKINFLMLCQMFGKGVQNIFAHTSTWFTVLLATARYIAICRPIHARYLLETRATIIAVIGITIFWIIISLPAFWSYTFVEITCKEENFKVLILDQGYFVKNKILKMTFTYIWSVLGFFFPVCILSYCNIHLIKALRESLRMRKLYRVNARNQNSGSHITPTLVAVIWQFIILMSPSEILHFYYYTSGADIVETITFAMVVTNILQTLNFSLNFILYCIVNTRFRGTVWQIVECRRLGLSRQNAQHAMISQRRSSGMSTTTRLTRMSSSRT